MPSGLDVKWLRRRRREHPSQNAPGPKEFRHARTRLRRHQVFVGVDIAKGDHYACVVTSAGAEVLASVRNDEAAIGRLIDDAAVHGKVALVIDTTSSAASLRWRRPLAERSLWPM